MESQNKCNVQVIRSPFEINGIQLLSTRDPSFRQQPQRKRSATQDKGSHLPIGSRGVRELVKTNRDDPSATSNGTGKRTQEPLRVISLHRKGVLLVWDCETHQLVGECSHGNKVSVEQCISTPKYLFTRVSCNPGQDVLKEDTNIYLWDAVTAKKAAVLRGHDGRVSAFAVSEENANILVTVGLDYKLSVWDISTQLDAPVRKADISELGIVNCLVLCGRLIILGGSNRAIGIVDLETLSTIAMTAPQSPFSTTAFHVAAKQAKDGASFPFHEAKFHLHTGSTDGYIREYEISACEKGEDAIRLVWQNKYHVASVTELATDDEIVVSSSSIDGAVIFHRTSGIVRKLDRKEDSSGSRAFVLDPFNKKVLVGSDNGSLFEISYSAFAAQTSKEVVILSVTRPHLSAITGLVLEVTRGNMWQRVLSASVDGTIAVMDYTYNERPQPSVKVHGSRKGKEQLISNGVTAVTDGAVNVPCVAYVPSDGRYGDVELVDGRTLTTFPQSSAVHHSSGVTALQFDTKSQLLLVGTKEGKVYAYKRVNGAFQLLREWFFPSFYVNCFSLCVQSRVAVGFIREDGENGAIAMLTLTAATPGSESVKLSPLELRATLPMSIYLASSLRPDGPLSVVVLETKFSLQQFSFDKTKEYFGAGTSLGKTLLPQSITLQSLERSAKVYFLAEKNVLRCAAWTQVATWENAPAVPLPLTPKDQVSALCVVDQSGLAAAFANEKSSDVLLVDGTGALVYTVGHDGGVQLASEVNNKRNRRVTFTYAENNNNNNNNYNNNLSSNASTSTFVDVQCCDLQVNRDRRFIVSCYSDGLVQVLDISNRYVFSRIWPTERVLKPMRLLLSSECFYVLKEISIDVVQIESHLVLRRDLMEV